MWVMSLDLEKIIDYLVFYCFAQYLYFAAQYGINSHVVKFKNSKKTKNNIMHVLAFPK